MEIRNLETFVQTAELGSFTKAAQTLGYSQSTVSFQIRQLEEELHTPLFERINHTIKLTPAGHQILAGAHQLLKLAGDMQRVSEESQEIRGHVRIVMADSLRQRLFDRDYEIFHRRYPGISMEVSSASTEEMFRLLNQNEADFVYTLDKHIYHPSYVIVHEEPIQAHFVASPADPVSRMENVSLEEIAEKPFILTEKGMSYRKLLDEFLASRSLYIQPFLETGDAALICQMTAQNLGISFLPDYATQKACETGRLCRLKIECFTPELWLQLLHHRDKWITPEMQCVADFLAAADI